ncbi:hypothetical protein M5K25_018921 [Dendrobium thyrsiflorum]|uniref:Uncharacterized protein n=1 Tax=Dendrobium thyrsiflorum TaxID=117978 RepID=A0ABD0UDJ2_DENTH
MIQEGISRLKESLSLLTDESLEAKAISNENFRCVMHFWSEDKDCLLWHTHDDVTKIKLYRAGDDLRDVGWRYVQQRFREHDGHLISLDFLKARIREIGRAREGSVEIVIERLMIDIDQCL